MAVAGVPPPPPTLSSRGWTVDFSLLESLPLMNSMLASGALVRMLQVPRAESSGEVEGKCGWTRRRKRRRGAGRDVKREELLLATAAAAAAEVDVDVGDGSCRKSARNLQLLKTS